MSTRRKFISTLAAAAPAAGAAAGSAAPPTVPPPPIRYVASPPPPKKGPHTGNLDALIQKLKPGSDLKLSFLHPQHRNVGEWKAQARAKMLELLHYDPEPCDPNSELLSRTDCGDYIREEVRFNTTPVFRVPATVLIPKNAKLPAPGVVALHSHGAFYMWGREREIETQDTHPSVLELREVASGGKAYATQLCRRGYVVVIIDMIYFGERRMILEDDPPAWRTRPATMTKEDVTLANQRNYACEQLMGRTLFCAGVTWAGIIAWDDIRTVDYLVSRPEVDPNRIGCVGHSVGGLRSAYLAALDDRIKASVICGWMCSFPHQLAKFIRSTVGHTKIIPGIYRHMDHPDIASLAMPSPVMIINGEKDELFDLPGVHAAHEKIAACYAKAGVPTHFRSIIENQPHQFSPRRQSEAWDWFDRWLV